MVLAGAAGISRSVLPFRSSVLEILEIRGTYPFLFGILTGSYLPFLADIRFLEILGIRPLSMILLESALPG